MKFVVSLVTVVALAVVWATRQEQVEIRSPFKIYSEVGHPIRFDFNVWSLNQNVSMCHMKSLLTLKFINIELINDIVFKLSISKYFLRSV